MTPPEANAIPIFVSEVEQFGGAERSLLALSRWLYEHGIANYLLTYVDAANLASHAQHPLTVVALSPGRGVRNKVRALKRHFANRPEDACTPLVSSYQSALHGTLAGLRGFHCLMHDTPSLFIDWKNHDLKARLRIAVSNRIIGWGLRSGGVTFVTSEYLRADCRRDFGIDARVVRMGGVSSEVPIPPVRATPQTSEDRLNLLSVCRIEPNKRIDWLLRSLAALEHGDQPLSSKVDWHFDLAGKGSIIPELTRLSESLGIASRVHFHGFVSDEELESLYTKAHLFLMPAVQGYGIPAIEALRRNLPVLLHRQSGVSDILLDTPWATVIEGDESGLTPMLAQAIQGIRTGRHALVPAPSIPTEDGWARQIVSVCGYLDLGSDNMKAAATDLPIPKETPCR
jgi:glycosyltransferase involved in cell wall biosynthesis